MAFSALTIGVDAFRGNYKRPISDDHPFKGEHSDASVIFNKNGGSTHRAEPTADVYNKYQDLVQTKKFKTRKSNYEKVYETVFGPTNEEIEFRRKIDALN